MRFFNKKKVEESSNHNNEFAKIIEWPVLWDTGAPMPQVYGNGHVTYLIYHIGSNDPKWDGTYTTVIDNSSENIYSLALVEFSGGTFRFGIANDEVFSGLSIAEKGMEWYSAHIVENSKWIDELKTIHKVHPYYNENSWQGKKHFLLLFHDEMFEVIANGFKIERIDSTFKNLAMEVAKRMNK